MWIGIFGVLLILLQPNGVHSLHIPLNVLKIAVASALAFNTVPQSPLPLQTSSFSSVLLAKEELPSIDKCFAAVRKELNPKEGESLLRIQRDIESSDFADLITFTREYDAGFRGGVLKSAWKQLQGDAKKRGIEVSNSFTFDLIALNKAARVKDVSEANRCLQLVRQDLLDFLQLDPSAASP